MRRPSRAVVYALAGTVLSLGELIGLLVVREISNLQPIANELLQQQATYIYVLLTTAVVQGCLGYLLGRQTDRLAELSETDARTGARCAGGWLTRSIEPRATVFLCRSWCSTSTG